MDRTVKVTAAFWSKVRKTKGHWWWGGVVNADGLGLWNEGGAWVEARKVAYARCGGKPEAKLLNTCGRMSCVHPKHMQEMSA
jgi:hypothetical protein